MDVVQDPTVKINETTRLRRRLLVTRVRHRGVSFVNTTTVPPSTQSNMSSTPRQPIKFVPAKKAGPRTAPRPITQDEIKRAQEGDNRKIAPKQGDLIQEAAKQNSLVPFQSVGTLTSHKPFPFSIVRVWSELVHKESSSISNPQLSAIDWALRGLPMEMSDDGKRCFHAYVFSCPIRHLPSEQQKIVGWWPLAKCQEHFDNLMLEPLTFRCTLTMGALFILLNSGNRESAAFAMHSARLCALVNKLLADQEQNILKQTIIIQSVASLAQLAVCFPGCDYHE